MFPPAYHIICPNTDYDRITFQDSSPDDTYFSEDCFHFSERGHAEMAAAMWSNMVCLARPEVEC